MSDYTRVNFREPMQCLEGRRFVEASDKVTLRKAIDPRRAGEGVEMVRGDVVEFFSIELVSLITYAPVRGTVVVADAPSVAKAGK